VKTIIIIIIIIISSSSSSSLNTAFAMDPYLTKHKYDNNHTDFGRFVDPGLLLPHTEAVLTMMEMGFL
jgi:hypothetical protein